MSYNYVPCFNRINFVIIPSYTSSYCFSYEDIEKGNCDVTIEGGIPFCDTLWQKRSGFRYCFTLPDVIFEQPLTTPMVSQLIENDTRAGVFFNKVTGLRPEALLKKDSDAGAFL